MEEAAYILIFAAVAGVVAVVLLQRNSTGQRLPSHEQRFLEAEREIIRRSVKEIDRHRSLSGYVSPTLLLVRYSDHYASILSDSQHQDRATRDIKNELSRVFSSSDMSAMTVNYVEDDVNGLELDVDFGRRTQHFQHDTPTASSNGSSASATPDQSAQGAHATQSGQQGPTGPRSDGGSLAEGRSSWMPGGGFNPQPSPANLSQPAGSNAATNTAPGADHQPPSASSDGFARPQPQQSNPSVPAPARPFGRPPGAGTPRKPTPGSPPPVGKKGMGRSAAARPAAGHQGKQQPPVGYPNHPVGYPPQPGRGASTPFPPPTPGAPPPAAPSGAAPGPGQLSHPAQTMHGGSQQGRAPSGAWTITSDFFHMVISPGQQVVVGRDTSAQLKIPEKSRNGAPLDRVSRRHATISATRDSLQISDGYGGAPSTHGTKVNGQRLAPHVPFATQSAATVTLADVATLYCRPGA